MLADAIDLERMQSQAVHACRLLKTLSNPDRLRILCQLSQGELCVSDIEAAVGITQPTLSQQLTVLRSQALVMTRREGKQIFYRIDSPPAMAVIAALYPHFCHPDRSPA